LAGRPLVSYPLEALAAAGLGAVVCAKPGEELPPLPARVVAEPESGLPRGEGRALRQGGGWGRGAQGGIGVRPLIVVACDMPFVPPLS
jgi:molybdopterin-guanine dinucleotide biosynthesis protein A